MTEENNQQSEETPKEPQPSREEVIYQQFSAIEPEVDIAVDDIGLSDSGYQSLSKRMQESPKLTDMQTADKRLFPDLGFDHLNTIQVSRIFPDIYNPFSRIMVKDILQDSEAEDMSVAKAIALVNTANSIAIDGEGRIDELGLAGVSHEENLEKEKTKNLGL